MVHPIAIYWWENGQNAGGENADGQNASGQNAALEPRRLGLTCICVSYDASKREVSTLSKITCMFNHCLSCIFVILLNPA